jgi:hypothetical protein
MHLATRGQIGMLIFGAGAESIYKLIFVNKPDFSGRTGSDAPLRSGHPASENDTLIAAGSYP